MPVNFSNSGTECIELLGETSYVANFLHLTIALLPIDIDDCCEVTNLVEDACLDCFPRLAFLKLPI